MTQREKDKDHEPTHSTGGHRKLRVPNPGHHLPVQRSESWKAEETDKRPLSFSTTTSSLHEQPHESPEKWCVKVHWSLREQFSSRDCRPALHVSGTRAHRRPVAPKCAATRGDRNKRGKKGRAPKLTKSSHCLPDVRGENELGAKGKALDLDQKPLGVSVQLHHLPATEPGTNRHVFTFCLSNGDNSLYLHQLW